MHTQHGWPAARRERDPEHVLQSVIIKRLLVPHVSEYLCSPWHARRLRAESAHEERITGAALELDKQRLPCCVRSWQ